MKRIINTLLFMFAAITMMAQTSFVVAEKNGNSQLVQSLIFKQQQYGDRYSSGIRFLWKTDGTANGDIKDLQFIARSQNHLASANSSDVTEMLEQISGTNQADADALAVTLENNDNVEESFSSDDGQSLFVQFKDDDVCSVYPMKHLYDPFEDETDDYGSYAKYNAQMRMKSAPQYRETGSRGKVAVFNYFSNQYTRNTQNRMLEYMMWDLNNHDYGVEYYPYEKMTLDNLLAVYNSSAKYTAVVIITHGFTKDNESFYVTGEKYDVSKTHESRYAKLFGSGEVSSDKVPFNIRFWNEGTGAFSFDEEYVFALRVKNFSLPNEVILYMGSCDAYPNGNNKNGTCVGWSGTQVTAQAHVTLLFYNLMRGKTLADALDEDNKQFPFFNQVGSQIDIWGRDPITSAKMDCQFKSIYRLTNDPDVSLVHLAPMRNYWRYGKCWLDGSSHIGPDFISDKEVKLKLTMQDDSYLNPDDTYPSKIYIKATPLRSDADPKIYSVKKKSGREYKPLKISLPENGVYVITAAADEDFIDEILIDVPIIYVKAKPFKENGIDWDEPDDIETFTVNGVSFNMINVEGGTFMMGSPDDDPDAGGEYSDEKPQHQVTLDSYSIGETEVTQALWKAVIGSNPSDYIGDDLPVENVSWNDCQVFIKKLNQLTGCTFRLPTEAEWEYAARGGNNSNGYKYSGSDDPDKVSWNYENSDFTTHSVGTKEPNELGIYDMSGNVWEWCQDYYDFYYYRNSPRYNPCNTTESSHRIHRGGSWGYIVTDLRVAMRGDYIRDENTILHGLRLAK